jgi:hypothetical protein
MARSDLDIFKSKDDFDLESFKNLAFTPIVAMAKAAAQRDKMDREEYYAICDILSEYVQDVDSCLKRVIDGKEVK